MPNNTIYFSAVAGQPVPTFIVAGTLEDGSPAMEMVLRPASVIGVSYSASLPDVATLGTLLATIPISAGACKTEVVNVSDADLTLVLDDGANGQRWHRPLTGVEAGKEGSEWVSESFRGRVRIYGPAGSPVSAWRG